MLISNLNGWNNGAKNGDSKPSVEDCPALGSCSLRLKKFREKPCYTNSFVRNRHRASNNMITTKSAAYRLRKATSLRFNRLP